MFGDGNTSNADGNEHTAPAVLCRSEAVQNGFAAGTGIDVTDGSSSGGFQTYKRRKRRKGSLETEPIKDGRCLVKAGTQLADEVCEFTAFDNQHRLLLCFKLCFLVLLQWKGGHLIFPSL